MATSFMNRVKVTPVVSQTWSKIGILCGVAVFIMMGTLMDFVENKAVLTDTVGTLCAKNEWVLPATKEGTATENLMMMVD